MMKSKNKGPAGKLGNNTKTPAYNNSSASQRARILKHFESCPKLSTIEARQVLGIMHPSGRIMELRRQGFLIHTYWNYESDTNGVNHRVGLYVFKGRRNKEIQLQLKQSLGGNSNGKN